MRWRAGVGLLAALGISSPGTAEAFSTRVHIVIANDVRDGLIASGDARSIKLRGSPFSVILSEQDARAITMHPLAFRGGAVGPDNMAFPAMTDPSHAIYQRPFVQCDVLYEAASNDEERAYAMGCFLHGATDAVAHHYVNYLTDETFTLNPMRSQRQSGFTNVIRHITAESMIQSAAFQLRPAELAQGRLTHTLPASFVARTYFDPKSELYPFFAGHAQGKLDEALTATGKPFFVVAGADAKLAPAEQLSLAPVYLAKADELRGDARKQIEKIVRDLQDKSTPSGMTLGIGAGPDGKLGTKDDTTACSASCPAIYARYFVSVGLLAPRADASGNALPSAFDKISEKLSSDLRGFIPAYLATVELISNKLNSGITAGGKDALDYSPADVALLFDPLLQWSNRLTTIDYQTLSQAVVPGWILAIEGALQSVGITVSVPNVMAALLTPVVQPIRDLIEQRVVDEAKDFLEQLSSAYTELVASTRNEYQTRLLASAGDGLQGNVLEHFFDSGIYMHAFNLAVATLAQRQVVLPASRTDAVGDGPASFDTSFSPAWTQAGLCDYLRDAVFPLGMDVKGALSVKDAAGTFVAKVTDDSAIECHDGAVDEFASTPTAEACTLTTLPELLAEKRGSLSRGFPPSLGAAACRNIRVPGLPEPKASEPPPPSAEAATKSAGEPSEGGCHMSPSTDGSWLLGLIALLVIRRRGAR